MFFCFPPILTMMHLCIMLCTYWTPLSIVRKRSSSGRPLQVVDLSTEKSRGCLMEVLANGTSKLLFRLPSLNLHFSLLYSFVVFFPVFAFRFHSPFQMW